MCVSNNGKRIGKGPSIDDVSSEKEEGGSLGLIWGYRGGKGYRNPKIEEISFMNVP